MKTVFERFLCHLDNYLSNSNRDPSRAICQIRSRPPVLTAAVAMTVITAVSIKRPWKTSVINTALIPPIVEQKVQMSPKPITLAVVEIPVVASRASAGAYNTTPLYRSNWSKKAKLAINRVAVPKRFCRYCNEYSYSCVKSVLIN